MKRLTFLALLTWLACEPYSPPTMRRIIVYPAPSPAEHSATPAPEPDASPGEKQWFTVQPIESGPFCRTVPSDPSESPKPCSPDDFKPVPSPLDDGDMVPVREGFLEPRIFSHACTMIGIVMCNHLSECDQSGDYLTQHACRQRFETACCRTAGDCKAPYPEAELPAWTACTSRLEQMSCEQREPPLECVTILHLPR